MKEFLRSLQDNKLLAIIKERVSPELEISGVLKQFETIPLLFDNVEGSSFRVAGNLYSRRDTIELGLGISKGQLVQALGEAVANPASSKGHLDSFDRADWDYNGDIDFAKLPILKHFDREAGRYITAGIVVAKFPGGKSENLSFHRMLILSGNKATARIVPRHLNKIGREAPEGKVPVSVIIGPPPAVFVAASLQTQFGLSEYQIANRLAHDDLRLTSSQDTDIAVPRDSEFVLEGEANFTETADEGPFVDLTGTYDEVRKQPVITFKRAHYRRDSVYQAVLASTAEHALFMGLPQELKIRDFLSRSIVGIQGINLTPSSGGYFHCIVSIEKSGDGDGKTAIMNCFAASHPLKLVVAVDSDIDPFDVAQVEFALATRFQADTGTVIVNGARGSSLDPSSGKLGVTSKLGLDCTLPVGRDKSKFERAEVPRVGATLISKIREQVTSVPAKR